MLTDVRGGVNDAAPQLCIEKGLRPRTSDNGCHLTLPSQQFPNHCENVP
jgi:hypothetical protein